MIQASPHPLLIAFRNPAGDLLDLVKINYKQNRSQETTETGLLPSRPHFVQSE